MTETTTASDSRSLKDEKADFVAVYREHCDYVVRASRGLGVPSDALDDVLQEVFVVVHRRLAGFEGRSTMRTWITGIVLRVVARHRSERKSRLLAVAGDELAAIVDDAPAADQRLEWQQSTVLLLALLNEIEDVRREVFVLSELEQMPMNEIALALDINVNTAYSRLRLAREDFEAALVRHRAREKRGAR